MCMFTKYMYHISIIVRTEPEIMDLCLLEVLDKIVLQFQTWLHPNTQSF